MSTSIESLVTQVKPSDQDEMAQLNRGGHAVTPPMTPPRLKGVASLTVDVSESSTTPATTRPWYSRIFCCCRPGRRDEHAPNPIKDTSQSPHPANKQGFAKSDDNSQDPEGKTQTGNSNSNPKNNTDNTSSSNGTAVPLRQPNGQPYLLPPQTDMKKKTLVLDLDETLVHSSFKVGSSLCHY